MSPSNVLNKRLLQDAYDKWGGNLSCNAHEACIDPNETQTAWGGNPFQIQYIIDTVLSKNGHKITTYGPYGEKTRQQVNGQWADVDSNGQTELNRFISVAVATVLAGDEEGPSSEGSHKAGVTGGMIRMSQDFWRSWFFSHVCGSRLCFSR